MGRPRGLLAEGLAEDAAEGLPDNAGNDYLNLTAGEDVEVAGWGWGGGQRQRADAEPAGRGEEGRLQGRAHRRGELRAAAVRHRGRAGGLQQGGGLPAVDTRYSARHLDTHGNRDLYDT